MSCNYSSCSNTVHLLHRTRARYTTRYQTQLIMSVIDWRVIRTAIQNSTLHPSSHRSHSCPSTHAPRATRSPTLHHLTLHTPSLKNSMYEHPHANLALFISSLVPLLCKEPMQPDVKKDCCYQLKVDYFSITACSQMFYSSYPTAGCQS